MASTDIPSTDIPSRIRMDCIAFPSKGMLAVACTSCCFEDSISFVEDLVRLFLPDPFETGSSVLE